VDGLSVFQVMLALFWVILTDVTLEITGGVGAAAD
jgi:hypothetical protein